VNTTFYQSFQVKGVRVHKTVCLHHEKVLLGKVGVVRQGKIDPAGSAGKVSRRRLCSSSPPCSTGWT